MRHSASAICAVLVLTSGVGCGDSSGSDGAEAAESTDTSGTGSESDESGPEETETDTGEPAVCGDGVVDADEECDDGEMNAANSTCTPECRINVCGDGYPFVDGLEECDDGNDVDTDACVAGCELAECGDGFIQEGAETCDDGNLVGGDGCSLECVEQRVVDVALALDHTCAVLNTGGVRCWGSASSGVLGYGNLNNIGDDEHPSAAGDVDIGGVAVQVTTGRRHTCALLDAGQVRCWGDNQVGRLGYPGSENVGDDETPMSAGDVQIGGTVVQISAGAQHTCVLLDTGKVRCWGDGADGQLGYGNTESIGDDEHPADAGDVTLGYDAVQIDAGGYHSCAVMTNGDVRCWGNSYYGQLGQEVDYNIGDDELPPLFGSVDIGGNAVQVTAGIAHTCVRLDTSDVRCWGNHGNGVLGYPGVGMPIGDDEPPTEVGTVNVGGPVIDISGGENHTCAAVETGGLRCWGGGIYGQLGYGNTDIVGFFEDPALAGDVPLDGTVVRVAAGTTHTCAVFDTGLLRCWGYNGSGELGLATTESIGDDELVTTVDPVQVF